MKSLEEVMARVDALKKDLEDLGVHVGVKSLGSLLEDEKKREIVSISLLLPVLEEDLEAESHFGVEEGDGKVASQLGTYRGDSRHRGRSRGGDHGGNRD